MSGEQLVGREVRKKFGKQYYKGKVAAYDAEYEWWSLEYEDGDTEEVERSELESILLPIAPCEQAPKRSKPGRRQQQQQEDDEDEEEQADGQQPGVAKRRPRADATARRQGTAQAGPVGHEGATECLSSATPGGKNAQLAASAGHRASAGPRSNAPRKGVTSAAAELQVSDPSAAPAAETTAMGGGNAAAVAGEDDAATGGGDPAAGPKAKRRKVLGSSGGGTVGGKGRGNKSKENKSPNYDGPLADELFAGVVLGKEYHHPRGKEPWRTVPGLKVAEVEDNSVESKALVAEIKKHYYKCHGEYTVSEKAREEEAKKTFQPGDKKTSKRPDVKAASATKQEFKHRLEALGLPCLGHHPGIPVGASLYQRGEASSLSFHLPPLGGIDIKFKLPRPLDVKVAISIVVSGGYRDNEDDGETITYTGEGGNDTLGNREQIADQKMERGNKALVYNIALGIPVRVLRKNPDPTSVYGHVYTYDGLYDVVKYEALKGEKGFLVYKYKLQRRPDQPPLLSKRAAFKGCCAPPKLDPLSKAGIVDPDLSGGLEAKPVVAVNEVDEAIPPCTSLDRLPTHEQVRGVTRGKGCDKYKAMEDYIPPMTYVTKYDWDDDIPEPEPAKLPATFDGEPHDYIMDLNLGQLPYTEHAAAKACKHPAMISRVVPILYECGAWSGCELGDRCPQAVTQQGLRYRLELFKTANRGWGVRSWDMIPVGSYICTFYGQVHRVCKEMEDDTYVFSMGKRSDYNWAGDVIEPGSDGVEAEYVVDAKHKGGIARWVNHSCDPTMFVQPVLSKHHDRSRPALCFFAMRNISPFEELTYDYGMQYIEVNLGGVCKCGTDGCVAKGGGNVASDDGGGSSQHPTAGASGGVLRSPCINSPGVPLPGSN